jgi:hypothetical protein
MSPSPRLRVPVYWSIRHVRRIQRRSGLTGRRTGNSVAKAVSNAIPAGALSNSIFLSDPSFFLSGFQEASKAPRTLDQPECFDPEIGMHQEF